MPPRKRRNNRIDEKEAQIIGEFLVTIGHEITEANAELRAEALKRSDLGGPPEYHWIQNGRAEYEMTMAVSKGDEEGDRARESKVIMTADYKRTASGNEYAPFNVLSGVIAPAERSREKVEFALSLMSDKVYPSGCPIFSVGDQKFWVVDPADMTHRMVELFPNGESTVTPITDLETLNKLTKWMFDFLRIQLIETYNDRR